MDTVTSRAGTPTAGPDQPDPRRWRALAVLGLVQFILVLDMTVVNVALPQIRSDLGFTESGLAWVVNGYVIMAGGLLLLGGRLADIFGRRRLFLIGVGVFAVASVVCGIAVAPAVLVSGRFVQGIGQALAMPASLGLIALMFQIPHERMKALGIWGGIAGLAGTFGTVISGLLTNLANWRWIFFINVPVAVLALVLVVRLVSESQMTRERGHRLDFPGAIMATGGLVAIVYGLLQAVAHPWGSWQVLLPLLGGVALMALMVVVEARSAAPLIPLRFFTNRTRLVANFSTLFLACAFFSYFFLMTLYQQQVLGYSPLTSGLSYLPLGLGMFVGVALTTTLMSRLGVKPLLSVGLLGAGVGVFLTSFIEVGGSYLGEVLPGMVVLGLFTGMCFPATGNAALHEVTGQDSGLASGVQNTMQQVGGALGLAILVTLALRHTQGQIGVGVSPDSAVTSGYALSFRVGAAVLVMAAVLVLTMLQNVRPQPGSKAIETGPDSIGAPDSSVAGRPVHSACRDRTDGSPQAERLNSAHP